MAEVGLPGLAAIAALPSVRRRVLVYPGDRVLRTEGGIEVLPAPVFFAELAKGRLFPE